MQREVACLFHTRPKIRASVAMMLRIAENTFNRSIINLANYTIWREISRKEWSLRQKHLIKQLLRIIAFSDSSFANNDDLGTPLGYVVLMTDDTERMYWLTFANYKCRRVVRSVSGVETYALADFFDAAYSIAHYI